MIISGELTVEAPREAVFDRLQDARRFVSLVEGVQDLTEIDPTHYNAVLETKIAYMRFKFKVSIDAAVTGKLGSMGQPLLRSKAKEMETQFANNLRAMFAEEAKVAVS